MKRLIFVGLLACFLCVACGKESSKYVTDASSLTYSDPSDDVGERKNQKYFVNKKKTKQKNDSKNKVDGNSKKRDKKKNQDVDFVEVKDYIKGIYIDLRYSTKNNFTGKIIYDFDKAYLRYGTVKKLKKVQNKLLKDDLTLVIWDAYRPTEAQFELWRVCPDPRYVANPQKGFSSHSRGNTVDISLYSLKDKKMLNMPTDFDDFSLKANRDYRDCTEEERNNALKLEVLMEKNGFKPYFGEWWHYSDKINYSVKKSIKNM